MSNPAFIRLENRALLSLQGADVRPFLQGLVSNDVTKVTHGHAVYSALLTPQGKYLFDFFIIQPNEDELDLLWLEVDASQLTDLNKRLRIFKLRSQVAIEVIQPAISFFALLNVPQPPILNDDRAVLFNDPRHPDLGQRLILETREDLPIELREIEEAAYSRYQQKCIELAVPASGQELVSDKTTLLEAGFDELNGLDWDKGCYMGQEVTARTKYRGLVKRRLMPVVVNEGSLNAGDELFQGDKKIGTVTSSMNVLGLASITVKSALAHLNQGVPIHLEDNKTSLTLAPPDWLLSVLESYPDD